MSGDVGCRMPRTPEAAGAAPCAQANEERPLLEAEVHQRRGDGALLRVQVDAWGAMGHRKREQQPPSPSLPRGRGEPQGRSPHHPDHIQSHQPSGRRQSRAFPLPTSYFPFGEGFTPPPTPSPGPGGGVPRAVRAPKMAQDGSKRASERSRWLLRSLKIAQHGFS